MYKKGFLDCGGMLHPAVANLIVRKDVITEYIYRYLNNILESQHYTDILYWTFIVLNLCI